MPVPKIEFCNSWIYDDHFRDFYRRQKREYPDYGKLDAKRRRLEKAWEKDGPAMLAEMQKATGLRWKEKKIQCFVVGRCLPFSYPLTVSIYEEYSIDYTIDVLTHELIHQLFVQNEEEMKKVWEYVFKTYKKEEFNTIIHVPVHAIHHHIFTELLSKKRLEREIDSMEDHPDYKRSWDIVLEEGAENIIKEIRKRAK